MWARLADFHVPLLHMVYGGNTNDAKQFVKYRVPISIIIVIFP